MTTAPVVVRPEDGLVLRRPKVVERVALSGQATGGTLMIMDITIEPGGLVAPVHVHTREDEAVLVVQGRVTVLVGEEPIHAEPGSVVWGPRGVAHSFWNDAHSTARVLVTITPGTLDGYFAHFRDRPEAAVPGGMVEYAARFGLELRLDSVAELAQRYHVQLQ